MSSQPSPSEILSKVHVAKPCPADWREMRGTERVRHCEHCDHKVYDISAMSRDEAADLILKSGGKLCVRYYTRPDGKIMTKDCGKPLSNPKPMRVALIAIASVFGLSFAFATNIKDSSHSGEASWITQIMDRMNSFLTGRSSGGYVMGDMATPMPPTSPTATSPTIMGKLAVAVPAKKPAPPHAIMGRPGAVVHGKKTPPKKP